ncbi:AF4/FMR2 family member 1 isoform X2 [Microcaecilia unicolor]|uniref:AF4/FMR2 family member 1 isoform X2 n=1 Tax=Microcaecilia unicolor TaxID=1415580 RepID=A0A6P7WTI0_9AMPH|nr:AF4/FMR2 family member 1 isoform X2 [Microcaecilia unicolor]
MAFMDMTTNSSNGLYNEDRNLLRLRERERRTQEALQERETFLDNAPLFAEPYKTVRGDELSNRIQSMLGNYEEVEETISTKSSQNLLGIPKGVRALTSQGKPNHTPLPKKISSMPQPSVHGGDHRPVGSAAAASTACSSCQRQKTQPNTEQCSDLHVRNYSSSHNQDQSQGQSSSQQNKKSSQLPDEQLPSLSKLPPLLSSLSPLGEPLSPSLSSQRVSSRPQPNKNHRKVYRHPAKSPQTMGMGPHETETRDDSNSVTNLTVANQPSLQTFPPSLPSKTSIVPQKPTAYVRPMDGQDQAPNESPELKSLPEDRHGQSYANFKASAKTKPSKIKMPSKSIEQTFSNEVHCVEEILKEMTHSWPPPLTAIHTPSTAEPSKFPFPTKDSQHISSVTQNQKQCDTTSKSLSSSQGTVEYDLVVSDDSDDDQVPEKPPPSSAPTSAPQSQPDSVASAHSVSADSDSTSDSDSSSGSDSESSSSESEVHEPLRTSTPEPDPPTANKWQLGSWLNKVSQPTAPVDVQSDLVQEQQTHQESKGHGKDSSCSHEPLDTKESYPKLSNKAPRTSAPRTSQEGHESKRSCQKSPPHCDGALPRQTVGKKQPRKSGQTSLKEEPKGGLKIESQPDPYSAKEQPSREKPKVKTKGKPKSSDKKDQKPPESLPLLPLEKKKHKSSHQIAKDTEHEKGHVALSHAEHSPSPLIHSQSLSKIRTTSSKSTAEDFHRKSVPLLTKDSRSVSLLRENRLPRSLVVKIELSLLSRVPKQSKKGYCPKKVKSNEDSSKKKHESENKGTETANKPHKKRKGEEHEKQVESKKVKLESETKSSSSSHKESSRIKVSKSSSANSKKELLPPRSSLMQSSQDPAKMAQKKQSSGSSVTSATSTATNKSNNEHASSFKHRKVEGKHPGHSNSHKGRIENNTKPFPVPSLPNGNHKPTRHQLRFDDELYPVEHYLIEAKKVKHKADGMQEKISKAFHYLDAALYFIQGGIAMESDTVTPKPAYTIFAETVDLIKFAMKLKNFTDSSASTAEKIFAVLCMRCQAVLYMAMFRHKKDTAIKHSRSLSEHFKNSSRAAQAPSPCVASTGTPSPLSPMPSPASSGGSQPSSNVSSSSSGGSNSNSSVSIPQMIHHIASSYVNITSYFLHAYNIWEHAELLAKNNKEFFVELSTVVCPLALNSSMTELVRYTRQGLHWLRLEASTL